MASPIAKVHGITARVGAHAELRVEESARVPAARRAVVVFGSGDSAELASRTERAAQVLNADPQAIAVLSGAPVKAGETEAQRMFRQLVEHHGVAAERLYTESAADCSVQNARFVAEMLQQAGADSATLVTSSYHARRARSFMKRALRETGQRDLALDVESVKQPLPPKPALQRAVHEKASQVAGHVLWGRFGD